MYGYSVEIIFILIKSITKVDPQYLSCRIKISDMGQSVAVVRRPHGNHQDVGSNPATARNENQTLGDPLHSRWPKGLDRISVEDRRC